jgi:nicotinate-nucleotide adenylyltransferase
MPGFLYRAVIAAPANNMKIGLFFGSFNPVHIGHLIIANHLATATNLDKVWMVVSPQNPLKPKKVLARDHDRLHLVRLAIGDNPRIEASNVEFDLPKPSYTVDTLAHLSERFPQHNFSLIMGGDNLASLHLWKNYEQILAQYDIYVYTRPGYDIGEWANHPRVTVCEAPLLDISATYIRESIKAGRSIQYLVPDPVFDYLKGSTIYHQL